MGSVVVVHEFSPSAYGVFPDQESSTCLLHWQADSLSLDHQGSRFALLCLVAQLCQLFVTPRTVASQAPLSMGIL